MSVRARSKVLLISLVLAIILASQVQAAETLFTVENQSGLELDVWVYASQAEKEANNPCRVVRIPSGQTSDISVDPDDPCAAQQQFYVEVWTNPPQDEPYDKFTINKGGFRTIGLRASGTSAQPRP